MKFIKFVTVLPFFTLMACDNGPNFAELCQQHSEICEEFQEDTWCKRERTIVGFANLAHKLEANDGNKYQQLIAYEGYEKCMAHAAKIEHIKLKVKKTIVHTGCRLSLQRHQHRREHWYIVQGQAKVTLNERQVELVPGQSIDIPCENIHRIENSGSEDLIFIEIQTGDYFGEDDIERLEDDFGRAL